MKREHHDWCKGYLPFQFSIGMTPNHSRNDLNRAGLNLLFIIVFTETQHFPLRAALGHSSEETLNQTQAGPGHLISECVSTGSCWPPKAKMVPLEETPPKPILSSSTPDLHTELSVSEFQPSARSCLEALRKAYVSSRWLRMSAGYRNQCLGV